jgi:hypothetical protein
MNTGQLGIWAQDLLNAQQRQAVAQESIAESLLQLVEFIVMRPTEDDDVETKRFGW